MMKKTIKTCAAIAASSVLTLSFVLAGGGSNKIDGIMNNNGIVETVQQFVNSETHPIICYDNLGLGYIGDETTTYTIDLQDGASIVNVTATALDGSEKALSEVATYNESAKTITAKSSGVVNVELKKGSKTSTLNVQVSPAYPEDPDNAYDTSSSTDYLRGSTAAGGLGGTHDPSIIETVEDGKKVYYMFSTGWDTGNDIHKSYDMIHWTYEGKATSASSDMSEVEKWIQLKNSNGGVQWWAPDIVVCPDGGYWLYTCCVSNEGIQLEGKNGYSSGEYSKAIIFLMHSDTLQAGSFKYVNTMMQSCIPQFGTEGGLDVNSIDPQIVYTPEGKMYMAYGSFGSGNWILELDPKTGLRKDGKNGIEMDWTKIRKYRDEAIALYNNDEVGCSHEFYGRMISKGAMEAPVLARHDNVQIYNTANNVNSDKLTELDEELSGKSYYYTMHSTDGLANPYAMWGGRSDDPTGIFESTIGTQVTNVSRRTGNKYMGAFTWKDKTAGIDIVAPGHNDLFTMSNGVNIATYIVRTDSYWDVAGYRVFFVQTHQYYLNALGDICINANRFAGEVERKVTKEEFLAFADNNQFKVVALENAFATVDSVYYTFNADGTITGEKMMSGTWRIYGDNYIAIQFYTTDPNSTYIGDTYYGVVSPAWLDDQYTVGMTISAMCHKGEHGGLALFANSVVPETIAKA